VTQTPSNPLLSSVNSGEFSPRMEARVDFERYPNAAKMCRNFLLLPEGGITKRPGSRYVAEVKDSSVDTILLPFQYSENDAWIIEAGNEYMRFYRRQAQITVEATDTAVTNGTFTGNATGWSLSNWSYGSNRISSSTTGGTAAQTLTVAVGDQGNLHCLAFEIEGQGTVTLTISDGSTTWTFKRAEGYHVVEFTPVANATITFTNNGSTRAVSPTVYLDNVAIVEGAFEVPTPYLEATEDLDTLRTFQAGDILYILSQSYAPYRLERYDTRTWSLSKVEFFDGPYLTFNTLESDVELFNLESKQLVTNPFFDNGLVNWTDASAGDGTVFSTSNGAELDDGTSGGSGEANLQTTVTHPNSGSSEAFIVHSFIVNQDVTFKVGTSAGDGTIANVTLQPGWNHTAFSTSTGTIHLEYSLQAYSGERSAVSASVCYHQGARFLKTSATTGSVTLTATGFAPFTSADVGRLMRVSFPGYDPGYGIITAYTSTTVVTLQIIREVPYAANTEDWSFGAWGGEQGYPSQMGFFNGRLLFCNTMKRPQTLWFSQSGDVENFRQDTFFNGLLTVSDTDAITVTLASKRIDPILWVTELNTLVLGTSGAQWSIESNGAVITPSDIVARVNSAIPCSVVQPIDVSRAILFTDKSNREMYEIAYSDEGQGYVPELITILADHIFDSPAHQLQYQRRPNSNCWAVRDDGRLEVMSYNRQHSILGWSTMIMGGVFGSGDAVVEHIAIIPGADDASQIQDSDERDEVWVIVKRTIDGGTVRYVEFIERDFSGPSREDHATETAWHTQMLTEQEDAFYVDSGVTYDGVSTSTITGLDHLEGATVKIWADGKAQIDQIVASGQVTLDQAASVVQVGLGYDAEYLSLKMATGSQDGTSVNKAKAIRGVGLVLLDSGPYIVASVDQDDVQGRVFNNMYKSSLRPTPLRNLATVTPLFTGEHYTSLDSTWSDDPRLYIKSTEPGPLTVIGIAPRILGTDDPSRE